MSSNPTRVGIPAHGLANPTHLPSWDRFYSKTDTLFRKPNTLFEPNTQHEELHWAGSSEGSGGVVSVGPTTGSSRVYPRTQRAATFRVQCGCVVGNFASTAPSTLAGVGHERPRVTAPCISLDFDATHSALGMSERRINGTEDLMEPNHSFSLTTTTHDAPAALSIAVGAARRRQRPQLHAMSSTDSSLLRHRQNLLTAFSTPTSCTRSCNVSRQYLRYRTRGHSAHSGWPCLPGEPRGGFLVPTLQNLPPKLADRRAPHAPVERDSGGSAVAFWRRGERHVVRVQSARRPWGILRSPDGSCRAELRQLGLGRRAADAGGASCTRCCLCDSAGREACGVSAQYTDVERWRGRADDAGGRGKRDGPLLTRTCADLCGLLRTFGTLRDGVAGRVMRTRRRDECNERCSCYGRKAARCRASPEMFHSTIVLCQNNIFILTLAYVVTYLREVGNLRSLSLSLEPFNAR
ncbi:hypothetical protein B0H15DRAFT_807452 [Mycena belliarum]|uniref:Uncharacterized protein n=1 Tax=Mycena belliarum TaxID=1033014 RepID=A0AAD6TL19_9AGAR|nr:hypothetical protein B0H15DRAFT_807452 [Mycena belliae]